MSNHVLIRLGVVLALTPVGHLVADCGWLPGDGVPEVGDSARATTVWDNGNGPALYVGGDFTVAGNVVVNRIARWNGTTWSPLGNGLGGWVHALSVYNGELIAGGEFTTAGGVSATYIARWNGASWAPLGTGSGMNDQVSALTVYNGELIAGGEFTTAGGVSADHNARWNGTSWAPLGTGMSGGRDPFMHALTVYNGELIAGGWFTTAGGVSVKRIVKWDGTNWCSAHRNLRDCQPNERNSS